MLFMVANRVWVDDGSAEFDVYLAENEGDALASDHVLCFGRTTQLHGKGLHPVYSGLK